MNVRIASAPARPGARAWMATLMTAGLAIAVGSAALAQAPPAPAPPAPKAQPKAQPKAAPQPPAPGPAAGAGDQPQITYSPWTKVCMKGPETNAQQVCFTGKEGRIDSGMLVVGAVLIEPEGSANKVLRVTLPLGMQLPQGTRVIVDQGQPMNAPYIVCFPNGCMADYEASSELVGKLKKGQGMVVQAINSQGNAVSLSVPLPDFAKAYDGPPTDQKTLEDRNKKMQEDMLKRQQQQPGAPK